jgi:hypothetical protein
VRFRFPPLRPSAFWSCAAATTPRRDSGKPPGAPGSGAGEVRPCCFHIGRGQGDGSGVDGNRSQWTRAPGRRQKTPDARPAPWLRLLLIAGWVLGLAAPAAAVGAKVCASGLITLGSFAEHIEKLRQSGRYSSADIDKLIGDQRAGGPDFFSSQIIIKEEQSGSGDFDLTLFHGHSDPHTRYRKRKAWSCGADDYPVAYFVGFRVRAIRGGAIFVARAKGVVDVISLKKLDPDLHKKTPVRDFRNHSLLCADIATGRVSTIFYGQW